MSSFSFINTLSFILSYFSYLFSITFNFPFIYNIFNFIYLSYFLFIFIIYFYSFIYSLFLFYLSYIFLIIRTPPPTPFIFVCKKLFFYILQRKMERLLHLSIYFTYKLSSHLILYISFTDLSNSTNTF